MRVWVLTPNNVMEVLYVKHGLNLKLKDSIVHDEDLVTSKNNNTVDLLLSEFVQLDHGLEVHDGMVWVHEFL